MHWVISVLDFSEDVVLYDITVTVGKLIHLCMLCEVLPELLENETWDQHMQKREDLQWP